MFYHRHYPSRWTKEALVTVLSLGLGLLTPAFPTFSEKEEEGDSAEIVNCERLFLETRFALITKK